MQMRQYEVTLKGETSLLLHNDNLEWADVMDEWKKDPANKKNSKAGDDRSPAWRWIGSLYVDDGILVIPSDNLMTVLREGGTRCPTGKGKKTFKAQTQSGIIVDQLAWPLLVDGETIEYSPIQAMIENPEYLEHKKLAKSLGFELFAKRAFISLGKKHVRVRPRFNRWSTVGTMTVVDDQITPEVLQNILTFAGTYSGLGDWRPSSTKSPGPFGKFSATIKAM